MLKNVKNKRFGDCNIRKKEKKTEDTSIEGGVPVSWLVRLPPDRVVWVRALAGAIVLCSWTRHFILTGPLSTQVYK